MVFFNKGDQIDLFPWWLKLFYFITQPDIFLFGFAIPTISGSIIVVKKLLIQMLIFSYLSITNKIIQNVVTNYFIFMTIQVYNYRLVNINSSHSNLFKNYINFNQHPHSNQLDWITVKTSPFFTEYAESCLEFYRVVPLKSRASFYFGIFIRFDNYYFTIKTLLFSVVLISQLLPKRDLH